MKTKRKREKRNTSATYLYHITQQLFLYTYIFYTATPKQQMTSIFTPPLRNRKAFLLKLRYLFTHISSFACKIHSNRQNSRFTYTPILITSFLISLSLATKKKKTKIKTEKYVCTTSASFEKQFEKKRDDQINEKKDPFRR